MDIQVSSYVFADLSVRGLPNNASEYDIASGRENACFDAAIQGFIAHVHLTRFRSELIAALEKAIGIEREHTLKDNKKVITEKDGSYMKRIEVTLLEQGRDLAEEFSSLAQEVMDSVPVNLAGRIRGLGTIGRPAQKWVDMANEIVKLGKLDAFCTKRGLTINEGEHLKDGELTEEGENLVGNKVRVVYLEEKKKLDEAVKASMLG